MDACHICGIPLDAGFFDESRILNPPTDDMPEQPVAEFQLPRNYCGVLLYFAQLVEPVQAQTPDLEWQIRCDGRPVAPYAGIRHIVNPWGLAGFPISLRLEEGTLVQLVVRRVGSGLSTLVGGRLLGRYWYNPIYGGAPNQL